ncbi:MAG: hypothetical protein P8M30_04855 [Planctomycetaceae bacterium]|jgi:hypothetical protein|nr:hypothetical protein [Planctomycetaceae bacterium]
MCERYEKLSGHSPAAQAAGALVSITTGRASSGTRVVLLMIASAAGACPTVFQPTCLRTEAMIPMLKRILLRIKNLGRQTGFWIRLDKLGRLFQAASVRLRRDSRLSHQVARILSSKETQHV